LRFVGGNISSGTAIATSHQHVAEPHTSSDQPRQREVYKLATHLLSAIQRLTPHHGRLIAWKPMSGCVCDGQRYLGFAPTAVCGQRAQLRSHSEIQLTRHHHGTMRGARSVHRNASACPVNKQSAHLSKLAPLRPTHTSFMSSARPSLR
jgi:hypothetical protein